MELAKSHHFVGNLMVLRPISSSHELSCFNEKSNSKRILELQGLYFQVRYQYIASSIQKNGLAVALITFFQPTVTCCYHQICRLSGFKMATNKTQKLQNLNCKTDCGVYCCSFEVMCDFQLPIIPTGSPFCRKFGTSHDFLPISHHFPSARFRVSYIFNFAFWGLASLGNCPEFFRK